LNGVTFGGGGAASGFFTFDADAGVPCSTGALTCGVFSNVDIVTTTGAGVTGATYTEVCGENVATCTGVLPNSTEVLFLTSTAANQTGLQAIAFFFTGVASVPPAGLSDSGGTFDVSNSSLNVGAVQEASCLDASCGSPTPPERGSVAGTVSSTPEPSSALLLAGAALAWLGLARFRRLSR
jgi:hypothetical protein